jgi:tetratricopeptide (TPR) repeat protein
MSAHWRFAVLTAMAAAAAGLTADVRAEPTSRQLFDQSTELYMSGCYRRAFEDFERAGRDEEWAARAGVARADCQLAWGDAEAALLTLQAIGEAGRTADWQRAAAAAHRAVGRIQPALEHGRAALRLDPGHTRARFELAALLESIGRQEEAIDTYRWFNDLLTQRFPESAADLHYAGLGFYRYSVLTRVANLAERTQYVLQDVLQPACTLVDVGYWPARQAIADLLREKYRPSEALEDYRTVLRRNPHAEEAHLGIGRIALGEWDFENVELRVETCLDINPRSVEARVLLAELRMLERRYEEAAAVCREALDINPQHIAALSYLAAAQLRCGLEEEARSTQQRVLEIDPQPATLEAIIGKQFSDARQFDEAEKHLQRAIEFDPTNPGPRNELAMLYMQWGREDLARDTADAAFELDEFNDRTKHTLDLLDVLERFQVHRTDHFEIHFDPARDPVIGERIGSYLESIYDELTEDYDTQLAERTIIEVFPDHRQFGVRIHGKPWIHTIGACTGRVIAMDAPREGVGGKYHYAAVLRHEFTHTVTLAATRNRIPHWLTEGLAVLQEDQPRSWTWMQLLAERLRKRELFPVGRIDWGFIRPRQPSDRSAAYAQSEWMCEFLIERQGYDVIPQMLERYREGATQAEVLAALTGMDESAFDQAFLTWAREQARDWGLALDPPPSELVVRGLLLFYPRSPALLAARAETLLQAGDDAAALSAAEAALDVDPQHQAALLMATVAAQRMAGAARSSREHADFAEQADDYARRLAQADPGDPDAAEFLAQWSLGRNDLDAAQSWAERLKALQPLNPESQRILSGLALRRGDDERALTELLQLASQDGHDADLRRQLGRIYKERGLLDEAARWYLQALHIDAYDAETHRLYADVLSELGRPEAAAQEFRMLTLLEPTSARNHSDLAFAYHQAGLRDRAAEAARRAVELDPGSPARQLLGD